MLYICVRTYADGIYINMVFPRIFTNYHECIEMCKKQIKTIKEELYYVKRKNQRKGKEWS